ncbi:hypothetical protein PNEG_01470 [Pneumocystis murina B123]|uniref:Uncharacterized protein n=1 Tax=Pneumocystis murina (strain B123) TaxID=1069680 RepID=M7NSF5_PNEMU|nr:hypothetical protein PNEG_01470 [Pneumocystis murina B123]EMR10197.1 hypothetical protein PNEG_01470 [Pneumocystis murina B123]
MLGRFFGIEYKSQESSLNKYLGKRSDIYEDVSRKSTGISMGLRCSFYFLEFKENMKLVKKMFSGLKDLVFFKYTLKSKIISSSEPYESIESSETKSLVLLGFSNPLTRRHVENTFLFKDVDKSKLENDSKADSNDFSGYFSKRALDFLDLDDKNATKTNVAEMTKTNVAEMTKTLDLSSNITFTTKTREPTTTKGTFTTILSETTEVSTSTIKLSAQRSHARSNDNLYMILGISSIAILIIIVIVFLVIYGVRRSLKKQEMIEDMVYENEMSAHAKLMEAASTPVSEKTSSTPTSISLSAPILGSRNSNDLYSRRGTYFDSNGIYGSKNGEKQDEQTLHNSSLKYYGMSQSTNNCPTSSRTRNSSYYNPSGQPTRSLSLSSRSKDYFGAHSHSSNVTSTYDDSFQKDRVRLTSCNNDMNGSSFGKASSNHLRTPNSVYLSGDQNRGYPASSQIRAGPLDSRGINRFLSQESLRSSRAHFATQPNTLNYKNSFKTLGTNFQMESSNFDTPNSHLSELSNNVSSPLFTYKDSLGSSSCYDSSFTNERMTPKSFFSRENMKNESYTPNSSFEKMFPKNTNKHSPNKDYMRTPSVYASVGIWAEKKRKLLDLTSNLNESSSNRFYEGMNTRQGHNINKK